ncbi:MAG: methyltransferase domain-containing protein [Nanoarchaeota archaeon]|nr:methyltransferase domain-containing protein [Nanoarchaeota archaeon]
MNKNERAYNKFAEQYHKDLLNSETNFWHKFVEKPAMMSLLKGNIKNKEVLDLGCGSGIFTKRLSSMGVDITGLDLSESLINIARRENPKIKFYVGNAKKTPFKKIQFDVITSSLMVHYVKDLNALFKEVSRILKKRGLFIFSMHHPVMEVTERLKINGKKSKIIQFNKYFHNNKYEWTLHKSANLISYHHTFENIVNSLNDSGFVVERLLETRAPKSSEKINKKVYDRTNMRPSFLVIKARKII